MNRMELDGLDPPTFLLVTHDRAYHQEAKLAGGRFVN
jgi:hypothetical protein